MSSLTTTWSPNSFRLRLALNWRKSPTVFVRLRVPKFDRQVRMFSVAGDSATNGNERRGSGNWWTNPNSSVDAFAGWSGADGAEKSSDSERKRWLGGIVGAGVAGVILVAGLTFAALSISKNTTRPKQQMEPLTTQQEMSLASDGQYDMVGEEGDEDKNEVLGSSLESKTSIDEDPSSYVENNEATVENGLSDDTNVGYTSNGGGIINNASIQQDLQNESAIDDMSVAPEGTPKLPESEVASVALVDSSFGHSDGSFVAEKLELPTELKDTTIDAKLTNSLLSDDNPTNLNTDYKEVVSSSSGTENSNSLLDSSSSSTAHGSNEPLAFKISVDSQLDAVLEPQITYKEDTETVKSLSIIEDHDLSKMPELSAEGNKSFLEVRSVNEGGASGTTSVSAVANQFANELDGNGYTDINGSRSFLHSSNPGTFFSSAGIPAPSVFSAALQALPGKVLVPAVVDQVQGQALAALQVLKVIETDVQPGDLCARREYARWLVSASSAFSRNTVSKVYPAMYIENATELAFDDITPEDPDFPSIQGLAEAGLISSKLSKCDMGSSLDEDQSSFCFCPESPLSRQDLVSWKMALEKRQLPVADRKILQQLSGFIDIDKINPDAWPAIMADLSSGEQGVISLAFGYTRLFQPDKPVTKAQAAVALATGEASDIVSEELARIEAESMAEKAVAAQSALVAEVEKYVNASFEKELSLERGKIDAMEKLAEEARRDLERLRAERVEENITLMKERAAVNSEMEILSRLRRELEEQLQTLMSDKVEISYEKERLGNLWKNAEFENQEFTRLQHELEVERKALSMARAWAEDEAKRAGEQAKALEEARDRWERHGIKVVVDDDLREEANAGATWLSAGKQFSVEEGTVNRAENLVDKLRTMAADLRGKSRQKIDKIIQKILLFVSILKEWVSKAGRGVGELKDAATFKVGGSLQELQQSSAEFTLAVKEGVKRVAGDCREGAEKLVHKFKT